MTRPILEGIVGPAKRPWMRVRFDGDPPRWTDVLVEAPGLTVNETFKSAARQLEAMTPAQLADLDAWAVPAPAHREQTLDAAAIEQLIRSPDATYVGPLYCPACGFRLPMQLVPEMTYRCRQCDRSVTVRISGRRVEAVAE